MTVRAESYVFTINNYTIEDVKRLVSLKEPWYVLFGKEVGASGTPHLQGVLWREDDVRFRRSQGEKLLGGRAYLDPVKDWLESVGYCLKDGDWWCNYASKEEILRVQEIVKDAKSIAPKTRWLAVTLFNALNSPLVPNDHESLLLYYKVHEDNK